MRNLFNIGRVFYGSAVAETGLQIIYDHDFPYWLIPPHPATPGFAVLAYVAGALLAFTGGCILLEKNIRPATLLAGGTLLLVFCFWFIPYQFVAGDYLSLAEWENAAKELSFASGLFIVAGCYLNKNDNALTKSLSKLVLVGPIMFALPIISYGVLHFLFADQVATMVPGWIPLPIFWSYFAGVALLGSGFSILLKIKVGIIAALLGTMIFSWFVILHIPRIIASPQDQMSGEVTSAFIALAYSGIALTIAGNNESMTGPPTR